MQGTPFCLVSDLRKQQLSLSSDFPGLQRCITSELLLMKVPNDLTSSVAARPLSIDVDVNVHVESTRDMYCHIRSRNRLAEGRSWSDWGQKRDDDVERLSRLVSARSRNLVRQIRRRGIEGSTEVGTEGDIEPRREA